MNFRLVESIPCPLLLSWLMEIVCSKLHMSCCITILLWESVGMKFTFPKWGLGSLLGLSKLQSLITKVKTPCIKVFFISLENSRSVDVENGLAWAIWTFVAHVMAKRRVRSQTRSLIPDFGVCKWSVIHRWKALEESYKFSLDLIPIIDLNKELWPCKVSGVQTGTVSKLFLGSLETKSHSDVDVVERCRDYYMGEGGGFPQVRAVVSFVSAELPVACLSTKGAPEIELINLLVGLM
jgi:hypothetical protein